MAEPEDPDILPTQPWAERSGTDPAPAIRIGASPLPGAKRPRWEAPAPEEVQRSFPEFEIVEILGRGGMGAVYKGWQKSLHRFVAIKILPPGAEGETKHHAERFQREARAMARFQHPSIVAVHHAGQTPEGLRYFVMEYVEGTDVQKVVTATGKLPPDEALNIVIKVCEALAYAHQQGVIHRDIKPSNIMVERNSGAVKVTDFGLAKLTTDDASLLTAPHVTMGTLDFMAPEAMTGMGSVDERADVYAVGVMLYQMLTGELPRGRFDLPSVQTPGLDARFDPIVDRAMQKNPDKRYASALDLRTDLTHILGPKKTAVLASESGIEVLPAATAKEGRLLYASLLAAAAVGGGALFFFRGTKPGGGVPQPPAQPPETPPALALPATFATATAQRPFENSLGMKFVPVPVQEGSEAGERVLFCIWETRLRDYRIFVQEQGVEWPPPHFEEPDEPAVNVTWNEAQQFCAWLTEREQTRGRISANERFRLPTDHEWSCAVGLENSESAMETPEEKHLKTDKLFPWGTDWPPPAGAGNYSGEEASGYETWRGQKLLVGYRDAFPEIAPVGSFPANRYGLFDLGGNAHEWCEDLFRGTDQAAVLRGASFVNDARENLLSSYRLARSFQTRSHSNGFRVVLAGPGPAPEPRKK